MNSYIDEEKLNIVRNRKGFIAALDQSGGSSGKTLEKYGIPKDSYSTDEEMFDLIIIDAAKAQNKNFFEKFKNNLSDKGLIIIDNLSFHGLVGKSSEIKSKNLKALVRKIENFITFLKENKEFNIEFIEVGDGIAICQKKK